MKLDSFVFKLTMYVLPEDVYTHLHRILPSVDGMLGPPAAALSPMEMQLVGLVHGR